MERAKYTEGGGKTQYAPLVVPLSELFLVFMVSSQQGNIFN